MLEAIDLCKVYKPKKGVPVTALNKISLKFPEKGMVFLLGKSGSGKSTLLNLLGGLDKYDSGEIIIKGVSSKDFRQQYFDSYRNTYVGFIFQEYNILDEFSVGANIALAIELQGRKATDGEINDILKQVDLEGYGNRKPNELSGGQKQRVAIARALVKNPEIIMADEPTGALDSNTGKQIFDTLKRLSKDKLVLIVSHDREFSEQYADRIIELADGNVISDVELEAELSPEEIAEQPKENLTFDGDLVEIAQGYHLTAEDTEAINRYIDAHPNERVKLGIGGKKAGVASRRFKDTDQSKIDRQDGSAFKLIKSVLPFKSAFKIGASGLKYKKFKLVMTILLSVVAFGLFGLSDTMGAYDHIKVCTNSLIDTGVRYVSLVKSVKEHYIYDDVFGEKEEIYWSSYNTGITDEQIKGIEESTGIKMAGVYDPVNVYLDLTGYYNPEAEFTKTDYNIYAVYLNGFVEINEQKLKDLECTLLAGSLPDGGRDEIAVSEYVFESFKIGGYMADGSRSAEKIEKYEDLIGKKLQFGKKTYTITGVVDTGFNLERYKTLTQEKPNQSRTDQILEFAMLNEFRTEQAYGISAALMVGDGYVDKMAAEQPDVHSINGYISLNNEDMDIYSGQYILYLDEIDRGKVTWVDGEKTELKDKEVIATMNSINVYSMDTVGSGTDKSELMEYLKKHTFYVNMENNRGEWTADEGYKVVGIIDDEAYENIEALALCDSLADEMVNRDRSGVYSYAVGRMPEEKSEVRELVKFSYDESGEIRYEIQNAVTYELDTVNSVFEVLSKTFLYIGLGFALFASLMLANFIGTSISYKKQEIGILRAIGARSNDVFKIFFSESFIIAMINFVISCAGVFALTKLFNSFTRYEAGILISVLTFSIRQVILLLFVSMAVAAVASFIPVKRIASKRPVDAIRNR